VTGPASSAPNGGARLVTGMLVLTAVAILEFTGFVKSGGALLVTVALWAALAQGAVAVVAACDLAGARWVEALRPDLLAAARIQPLLVVLFAFLAPQLDLYGWSASPGGWLNGPFFLARNLVLLAVAAGLARAFSASSLRRGPATRRLAVAYLLAYVVCQTLVAFDWVMSLSYPWVSSMLGLFFFVEALYAGLALAGLLFLARDGGRRGGGVEGEGWRAAAGDAGLLIFGFSVLWGGLFFAQFMLLWYGNLPEEVSFIALRLQGAPTRQLAPFFIAACWATPFFGLLPARSKRSVLAVGLVSFVILAGLLAERLYLVMPALRPDLAVLATENALLAAAWVVAVWTGRRAERG